MLKSLLLGSIIVVSLYAFDYDLYPKKVAEDTYCFFGKLESISAENSGNMVNTCFVQTKEGFVVIDSGPTYDYANMVYLQMQRIAKLPVKYVITTHEHDDHWLGNGFYKSKGALLIGSKSYEQNITPKMQTRMERILGKEVYGDAGIVAIDKVVEQNMTIRLGEKIFEISQPVVKAHTKGDLIVWMPKTSVLFSGDLIFDGRITSLRDGSLLGSLKAIEKLRSYHPRVIIPGHGYRTSPEILKAYRRYLEDLRQEVLLALNMDVGLELLTKKVKLSKYNQLKLYNALNARNILDTYTELEMIEDEEE